VTAKVCELAIGKRAKPDDQSRPPDTSLTWLQKPVFRPCLARRRPIALGKHRYKWLYVTGFVQPNSGETVWFLSPDLSKPLFEAMLAAFARDVGAGLRRRIILVLDNAGWHTPQNLRVPDGISLVFLAPYTPELQPAECLWKLVDEPAVNTTFDSLAQLEEAIAEHCRSMPKAAISATDFHWWPQVKRPS